MGRAERKAIQEGFEVDSGIAFPNVFAANLPGTPTDATVAATERLKKFRRLKASFLIRDFKGQLLGRL
jgi:hypothetical protein